MKRHFPALRGFAIILVVVNHAIHMANIARQEAGMTGIDPLSQMILMILSALGFMAVPIFLFLSGSFFAYAAQGNPPSLPLKIIRKNLTVVVWPYVIWSLGFYLLLFIGHRQVFSLFEYVKHLLVGYPFNFVPLIIFFMVVSPLLLWFSNKVGWLAALGLIASYQVLLILIVFPNSHGLTLPGWSRWLAPPVLAQTLADWGIYFPLGMLYALNMKKTTPWLERLRWPLLVIAIGGYIATLLHGVDIWNAPLVRHIFPFAAVLLLPLIPRYAIYQARWFEYVGKYAYGLYLTHLIVIDVLLLFITEVWPAALQYTLILAPILFGFGLYIPLLAMMFIAKTPARKSYQCLFG